MQKEFVFVQDGDFILNQKVGIGLAWSLFEYIACSLRIAKKPPQQKPVH